MKKIIVLLMVCIIVGLCGCASSSETKKEFDDSKLSSLTCQEDEMSGISAYFAPIEGKTAIQKICGSEFYTNIGNNTEYTVNFSMEEEEVFCVSANIIKDLDKEVSYSLVLGFFTKEDIPAKTGGSVGALDEVIIKTEKARYKFSVGHGRDYLHGNIGYLYAGQDALTMIEDIVSCETEVAVRMTLRDGYIDYVMTADQIESIAKVYEAYIDANGAEQGLSKYDEYEIVIQK